MNNAPNFARLTQSKTKNWNIQTNQRKKRNKKKIISKSNDE